MEQILLSWIGGNDLAAFEQHREEQTRYGPVLSTLRMEKFSQALLLYNYDKDRVAPYLDWLEDQTDTRLETSHWDLSSPIHFGEIHEVADGALRRVSDRYPNAKLSILLSPGTPAMQAVWILLGKTRYPCTFYQSSREQGVQRAEIPFNIAAEFVPELAVRGARQLGSITAGSVPVNAAFDDILTHNPDMQALKAQASVMATRDVPVLIQGDTGTGKELFATAIHNASLRRDAALIPVNCGAIPAELIDSALFGHKKGAFTGAVKDKAGYFDAADGGTLFLDEFGELPLDAQVRLLRVLQTGELTPVGSARPHQVDVRIIAATNRNLLDEVAAGRFREDLFYRVAVGLLHLPPLRQRPGDLIALAEHLMEQINSDAAGQPGYVSKTITPKAKKQILQQPWRGNVRELYSTLLRASLWSSDDRLGEQALTTALFGSEDPNAGVLDHAIGDGFEIQSVMDQVAAHYIGDALRQAGGNKTQAAKLIGLSSQQTLSNWIKRHGVKQ